MNIALIGYLHGAGGAERQIIMLSNSLASRGHDVHLIVLAEFQKKYDISEYVKVHDLTCHESVKIKGIIQVQRFLALQKELNNIRPDVSIHFWLQSAKFATLMRKEYVGKIIYAERGDPGDSEYSGLSGIIRNYAFKVIDGFVFQSAGARDYFGESILTRSTIIPNSVSVPEDDFLIPCPIRSNEIVSVGRLHPQKNQKLLIAAFAEVVKAFPNLKLTIYGTGGLHDELIQFSKDLGIEEYVQLPGNRKDIFNAIYPAKLFVLTSDYEGMPNALMEAMALGIPSISTDCKPGGARELIIDGINGLLVPRDDKKQLTNAMIRMLTQEDEAEKMAKRAQQIRSNHTECAVFQMWESFVESVVKDSDDKEKKD